NEGIKTKITLTFRGREMEHIEIGKSLLARVAEEIKEAGTIEHTPRLEGRNIIMVISPKS
ncbi:MAG: translation initiation factor IF-3, partial [Nitrospirota bacterium]